MIEIKTLAEFNEKVKAFRSENGKTVSNCFLMPGEITELSSQGKLFIGEYPKWLLILCNREDYANLYYYTVADSDVSFVKEFVKSVNTKEVYMDAVSRMGRGDCLTPSRLIDEGAAEKYKVYQRMQLPVKDIDFGSVSVNLAEGYIMSTDYCGFQALNALWKDALDEKSTPLPKEEELKKICEEGHLFTVLDSSGNPVAVTVLTVSAGQGLIQHVSVSKQHRRKGLAVSLMNKSLLAARDEGLTMLRLWVDCENTSAIALYDRFNFEKDGMLCDQLYMKGF